MPKLYLLSFFLLSLSACTPNNVIEDKSIKKYFDEHQATGCFGLFENGQGIFKIYNLQRFKDSAYLPGSTFDIVNALVAIQTGRVKDSSTVIPWDGITRGKKEWNQNLTLTEAFHLSSVPVFQEIARRVGKDTMQTWLDTVGYGAITAKGRAVIKQIDSFWLNNTVKITGDEQLGLVKKLYFEQLPFYNRTQGIVKRMMVQEEQNNFTLCYKSGSGLTESGRVLGWVIGWIEENKHPVFFALQTEPVGNNNLDVEGVKLLKQILVHLGYGKEK